MCQPAQSQVQLQVVLNANGDPAEGIRDDKQVSQGLRELPGFLFETDQQLKNIFIFFNVKMFSL